jgi:hypothetical protein
MIMAPTVDPDRAIEAAKAHFWPGHPDQPRPYDSLAALRAELDPYRTDRPAATCWHVRRRKATDPAPDGWKYSRTFTRRAQAEPEADAWNGTDPNAGAAVGGYIAEVMPGPAPEPPRPQGRGHAERNHTTGPGICLVSACELSLTDRPGGTS